MIKKVIVLLAEGFEEVEAVTPIDYLRRAGIEVITAAIGKDRIVTGSHGIALTADLLLEELTAKTGADAVPASLETSAFPDASALYDAVLIPGGMNGANNLAASAAAGAVLKGMAETGKWVCAICAAPAVVLYPLGLLAGRRFTCYPGMEHDVSGAKWSKDNVVVDENADGGGLITSRGAGTAGLFAIAVIEKLLSKAEAKKVAEAVLL
jgi:4-methyl-5(b-hydroxyethyl)-thiazole monophosphate biosynthesis